MLDDLFDRELTPTIVLDVLGDHVGADNGIRARDLVAKIAGVSTTGGERRLRKVIEALRTAGHRVGGLPDTGYFLAATDTELDATCAWLYGRAMTTLKQVAVLRRVALPDLRGQLRIPLNQESPS